MTGLQADIEGNSFWICNCGISTLLRPPTSFLFPSLPSSSLRPRRGRRVTNEATHCAEDEHTETARANVETFTVKHSVHRCPRRWREGRGNECVPQCTLCWPSRPGHSLRIHRTQCRFPRVGIRPLLRNRSTVSLRGPSSVLAHLGIFSPPPSR